MSSDPVMKRKSPVVVNSLPKLSKQEISQYTSVASSPEDAICVNTIRVLTPAIVWKGKSGHPGAPMGCALMAHAIFGHMMTCAPKHPRDFWGRDRFVLSNGHASALQYFMLHLTGYDVTMKDLQSFRQLNSKTPGHPESAETPGVEVTTGPLGQGIAQAVGLAVAARIMRTKYGSKLFNNKTYVILGDGCVQEGICAEACALAGHWGLGGLIALYDRNGITIDGDTSISFTEDVAGKFHAWGWKVLYVKNCDYDLDGLLDALYDARDTEDKPVLIVCDTTIGYGSKKQGTAKVHGSPLSDTEVLELRKQCGFSEDLWDIPAETLAFYKKRQEYYEKKYNEWKADFDAADDSVKEELKMRFEGRTEDQKNALVAEFLKAYTKSDPEAPRNLSEKVLKVAAKLMPDLIGGSADLKESNKTDVTEELGGGFHAINNPSGRYIYFGVREHAMVAIANGLAAYGGFRPFTATFLNFYTYAWGACRLSALSHLGILNLATHDSIELGEDGPTHQPIETPALIRATPNANFFRPGDMKEVAAAFKTWLDCAKSPIFVALARGKTPQNLENTCCQKACKGAYVTVDFANNGKPKVVLAASGSELSCVYETAQLLKDSHDARIVSMPCVDLLKNQSAEYIESVLPKNIPCGVLEPYSEVGIYSKFDLEISCVLNTFGVSAPCKDIYNHFGLTAQAWAEKVRKCVA